MHEPFSITLAVIGDPHVIVRTPPNLDARTHTQHSFFEVEDETGSMSKASPLQHPWLDLLSLIEAPDGPGSSPISVDALLCAGDLGFQGDTSSIRAAWKLIQDAGVAMGAKYVAAATGNHDVKSRSQAKSVGADPVRELPKVTGPFETLKLLEPTYPFIDVKNSMSPSQIRNARARYFGEGAALYEFDHLRLLVVNSCADHGHEPYEFERGSVGGSTRNQLKTDLASSSIGGDKINIALFHHPPSPDSAYGSGTMDHIHEGDQLIQILEDACQPWLVVHGHKHHGTISYSKGSGNVTIFSAASLGIRLERQMGGVRNQFYVVELNLEPDRGELLGTVRCWDWFQNIGWQRAQPHSGGICDGSGFGAHLTPALIASQIEVFVRTRPLPCPWSAVVSAIPALAFVIPDQMQRARSRLQDNHQLIIELDKDGYWYQIARKS